MASFNDLMILPDEVYKPLIYEGIKHVRIASLLGMKGRTFALNGISKSYVMDGWRLGCVAASAEYISVLYKSTSTTLLVPLTLCRLQAVQLLREKEWKLRTW